MKLSNLITIFLFLPFMISCSENQEEASATVNYTNPEHNPASESGHIGEGNLTINTDISLSPIEFRDWVNHSSSPLIKQKEIAEYNYELKYLPVDYLITNEVKTDVLEKDLHDSLANEYNGMEYFELKLSVDHFNDEPAKYNVGDMSVYQQRIMYLSFAMQDDIYLEFPNGNKAKCKLYHNERIYGVGPYSKFLFGFSKEDIDPNTDEFKVVINDQLFNTGLIKFNWNREVLTNVPKMKLS